MMQKKQNINSLRSLILILICIIVTVNISACQTTPNRSTQDANKHVSYKKSISLGNALAFRPRRLPSGGATSSHACIRGDYNHVYETNGGYHGDEVWLCCVPVNEILRDSFHCASTLLPITHLGGVDHMKIRYCTLLHPTNTEATYIPVCIPAPLTAPGFRIR